MRSMPVFPLISTVAEISTDRWKLGNFLDIVQFHRLDSDTSAEEIMQALNDVINSGKMRHFSVKSVNYPEPHSNV